MFLGIQSDGSVIPPSEQQDGFDVMEEEDRLLAEDSKPPFEPFHDLCKRRLLWYYETYMNTIKAQNAEYKRGVTFVRMPFESFGNTMDGRFDYPDLERRLTLIRDTIMEETASWAEQGLKAKARDAGLAITLQRHFEQIVEEYKMRQHFTIDLAMEDENPFIWILTYFGKPMTQLDGGIFRIRICLSTKFPEEQPRAMMQTPLFHHRISKEGVVCYFPRRPEEMKSHIEGIVEALEEEAPPYDPRATVNPEASKLLWGSRDDKKKYNRLLRRSVQRSVE
jgi:ubiquitin-conjugating enzyme E2 Z